jgi:hypothetical protein
MTKKHLKTLPLNSQCQLKKSKRKRKGTQTSSLLLLPICLGPKTVTPKRLKRRSQLETQMMMMQATESKPLFSLTSR